MKLQIEMAEKYQKIHRLGHFVYDLDCVTLCTRFALSDPLCIDQYFDCSRPHVVNCRDCLNVISTLDEIAEQIRKISDEELRRETSYDFENSTQYIHEWFRHNIRAAQQNKEKVNIISNMTSSEAFATFDWAQKVLPQEHREGRGTCYGKSGMSLLVGSFVWNRGHIASSISTIAPNNAGAVPNSLFCTESYILALTSAD